MFRMSSRPQRRSGCGPQTRGEGGLHWLIYQHLRRVDNLPFHTWLILRGADLARALLLVRGAARSLEGLSWALRLEPKESCLVSGHKRGRMRRESGLVFGPHAQRRHNNPGHRECDGANHTRREGVRRHQALLAPCPRRAGQRWGHLVPLTFSRPLLES